MKKFINLLNFELNRFLKFLLPALVIAVVMQLASVLNLVFSYNKKAKSIMASGPGTVQSVVNDINTLSMRDLTGSGLFNYSLVLLVSIFVFYSFFVWYRDWLGKNTFIYRLLMLPIGRFQIFLTKSLSFLIGGFLVFSVQFGLFFIESALMKQLIVQQEFFVSLNIHDIHPMYDFMFGTIFPNSMIEFLSTYGFAFAALVVLFTAIILERSFGIKGLISGVVYLGAFISAYTFLSGLAYYDFLPFVIKPSQAYLISIAFHFVAIAISMFLSNFLLTRKIKV